jgi:uridine phosphorylase
VPHRSARRASNAAPEPTYHLRVAPGQLPDRVLIPGDPARAERIARSWDAFEPVAEHREFRTFRGVFRGTELAVTSCGIGGPAMAIAVEELARVGCRTLIRVGSSGPIDPALKGGEVVIATAAARFEGTSRAYAPAGYPAVADPEVYQALLAAARSLRVPYRTGITATVDTFHPSQGKPSVRPTVPQRDVVRVDELEALGIVNIEMEASTLLTVANVLGLRAGVVCAVYPDRDDGRPVPQGEERAIAVANEAARRLAA